MYLTVSVFVYRIFICHMLHCGGEHLALDIVSRSCLKPFHLGLLQNVDFLVFYVVEIA